MTRRAAIIPGGWTAIVVAEESDTSTLPVVILAESFEVGRLVDDELGAKRREWTDADVDLALRRAMQRFIDLNVESVVIEWATSKTSKAHALAQAVKLECLRSNIASTYAKKWRLWNAAEHRAWVARRILEGFSGWPTDTFTVARDCGVMLLESIAPERPAQFPEPPKEKIPAPSFESSDAPIEAAPVAPVEASPKRRGKRKPAPPVVLLPRTAGIDPGSGHLGLVITEGTTVPVQLIHRVTLPVGEKVPLKRPRKIKRDEETITLTTRHSLTAPMAKALADKIVARLVEYRVTRLAIEHVEAVHMDAKNVGAASSIATSLIRTSWLDMLIGERAEAAGIEVHRVSAATWRASVAGRRQRGAAGGAGAELIPNAVASRISGWPPDTDAHERDAAGVNLWLILPPPEAPPPPPKKARAPRLGTPKTSREPGKRAASYYAFLERQRNETAQARTAVGCKCENLRQGRHRAECSLADDSLLAMDRKFLTALAQHPSGLSKQKMLTLAGYRYGASVNEALERLRCKERVIGQPHELRITEAGLRALETG